MTRNRLVIILNVIVSILFIIPTFKLNLLNENYSTLSLTTRGYLYVLFLGIIIGSLLSYETYIISKNKIRSLIMFLSLLVGTIIPHHVPYNLQGNLHLLFAYIGFTGMAISTIINIKSTKYYNVYLLFLVLAVTFYLKCGMVNTISEVIVMLSSLYFNLITSIKKED